VRASYLAKLSNPIAGTYDIRYRRRSVRWFDCISKSKYLGLHSKLVLTARNRSATIL
jgi:hypothetical protein